MPRRINLVPKGERARTTTNVGALGLVVLGIVVLFGLGLGYYLFSNTLSDRRQELGDIEAERASLEAQVNALREYGLLASERVAVEKVVQGVYAGRTLVNEILTDISQVIPSNVWFVGMNLSTLDPGVDLEDTGSSPGAGGNVFSVDGNTYSFEDVAQVLVRLQLVQALQVVTLLSAGEPVGAVDETQDVKGFSIDAVVVNTQPEDTPLPLSILTEME